MPVVTDPSELGRLTPISGIPGEPPKEESIFSKVWKYPTTPTERPRTLSEFITRAVPESVAKTGIGMVRFPVDVAQAVASPERGERLGEMGKGVLHAIADPIGIFGLEKMKEKWLTDPAGSVLALSPIFKWGLGKAGFKPIVRQGEVIQGKPGQFHYDVIKEKGIPPERVAERGFINELGEWSNPGNLKGPGSMKPTPKELQGQGAPNVIPSLKLHAEPLNRLEKMWNWYVGGGIKEQTPYRGIIKDYLLAENAIYSKVKQKTMQLLKIVPQATKREAMFNYIEAGGNLETLRYWAEHPPSGALKKGYEDALKLTDQDKGIIEGHQKNMDRLGKMAIEQDILEHLIENFIHRVWDNESPALAKKLKGSFDSANWKEFATNPSLIRHRIFKTAYEAEQMGYRMKHKDIAWLDSEYEQSLLRAINARSTVKRLFESKASDGRPNVAIEGSGTPVPRGEAPEAVLVKPHARPEELRDFKRIDHGALKKWKWVSTIEGKNVFMQGDAIVHPEAYGHLKNLLSRSKVRENEFGRVGLKAVLTLKQTLLSFSGFHQTQVTLHGLFHRVGPWKLKEVNLRDPVDQGLVRGGMTMGGGDFRELFHEGVASSELVKKIPGIGPFLGRYTDWLFESYIPRLKAKMGREAYRRNTERYGKELTQEQIFELTANQANKAFGELNYKLVGRNPTTQDVLRLMFLAPDFLEARAGFVGQALRPYGKEQAVALLLGSLGMYVPFRIWNSVVDGDPHFEMPFSGIVPKFMAGGHKRVFTLRSIPGDLEHLIEDPRGFIYYRLSSATRTAMEAFFGRNMYGQRVLAEDQIRDFLRNAIPIPFQTMGLEKIPGAGKWIGKPPGADLPFWESFARSIGVSSWPYKSMAEKEGLQLLSERMPKSAIKYEEREKRAVKREIVESLRNRAEIPKSFQKLVKEGKVTSEDLKKIFKESGMSNLESIFHRLSLDEALHVWQYTTKEEKGLIRPVLMDKINRAMASNKITPEIQEELFELNI